MKHITEVYNAACHALARGRVLIVYLDGLGWSLYQRAGLPFIKKTFECEMAESVFPPVTHCCMASMLTGEMPEIHGIRSRRDHRAKVPSLMSVPGAVLVEGDEELLSLEQQPILTLPDRPGGEDAALLAETMKQVNGNAPLIIAHFHGLDDLEHEYGDCEPPLREKLTELDNAVKALCDGFHGTVILCADHGVHSENGHGAHGNSVEDMLIPLGVAKI